MRRASLILVLLAACRSTAHRAADAAAPPPSADAAVGPDADPAHVGRIEGTLVGFAAPPRVRVHPAGRPSEGLRGAVDGTSFHTPFLAPGRYLVSAQNAGEGAATLVEVPPNGTARVTLTSGGSGAIEATVTEWSSGAPIPGLLCRAVVAVGGDHGGALDLDPAAAPRTDGDGRVVIDPAPAGEVVLQCLSETMATSPAWRRVTVPRGGRARVTAQAVVPGPAPRGIGRAGLLIDSAGVAPRVVSVEPGGPAASAGLRAGDVIVSLDGRDTSELGVGVQLLLFMRAPGETVRVGVRRGTENSVITLTLGAEH